MVSAEKKKKEKKRNKWPRILLLSKEGYINYKIPKIPLRTNIGYYILPSLKKIRPRILQTKEKQMNINSMKRDRDRPSSSLPLSPKYSLRQNDYSTKLLPWEYP